MHSPTSPYIQATLGFEFPFLSLWGKCLGEFQGKSFCSFDEFKPKEIKFPRGNLAGEKSVTLADVNWLRKTVNKSIFSW